MRALFTAAAVASIGLCAAAHAGTITWSQFTDNATTQAFTVDGKTVTATGRDAAGGVGAFLKKSMNVMGTSWGGVGIAGDAVNAEIDGLNPGEAITFDFTGYDPAGVKLGYLEVAFLFLRYNWDDRVDEAARFIVNGSDVYELVSTGSYTPVAGATVSNISLPKQDIGAGVWRVDNPFLTPVKTLTLVAGTGAGLTAGGSDYAFRELSIIPLPPAVWSGLGLLAMVGAARLRKHQA